MTRKELMFGILENSITYKLGQVEVVEDNDGITVHSINKSAGNTVFFETCLIAAFENAGLDQYVYYNSKEGTCLRVY